MVAPPLSEAGPFLFLTLNFLWVPCPCRVFGDRACPELVEGVGILTFLQIHNATNRARIRKLSEL